MFTWKWKIFSGSQSRSQDPNSSFKISIQVLISLGMYLKKQKRCFGDILGGSFKLKPSVSFHVHLEEVEFSGCQSRSQDPNWGFKISKSSPYQLRDVLCKGQKVVLGILGGSLKPNVPFYVHLDMEYSFRISIQVLINLGMSLKGQKVVLVNLGGP
jgi:hypothetical protein